MDWVDRLQQAVNAKGKQESVADEAGVDRSALSDILRRDTLNPKLFTVYRVCRVCDVTVGWVLGEKGFELGEDDFQQLDSIATWSARKLAERGQETIAPPRPRRREKSAELPAVATARGETYDDEMRGRDIPREYQNEGANSVFVTRGDSMIDAGIFEGDVLFVKKSKNRRVANGKIVVCRLDGTFTVKRLHIEGNIISLISEKQGDAPITINEEAERFELIGIVIGVTRDLFGRR
ncbi:MAG TPA: S24 family peptidase [Thermoanaerobaculia bacterium]|nr:S24 family peptidase [Thermoanaerobaculia bacterium]